MNRNAYVTEDFSNDLFKRAKSEDRKSTSVAGVDFPDEDVCPLNKLNNHELLSRFGKLVQTERKITHLVLECIAEIDLRKLYLERAFPSLYEFLVQGHGYSPSSALRRIESARLLQEIPEIAQKIECGALNLSQISLAAQGIRQVQKIEDRKVETCEKIELLSKMEYSTQYQSELIIAQEFNLPVNQEEKHKIHRDESVTLTITFSKDEMAALEQVADLIAHSVPDKKWCKVINYLVQKEINQRTKIKRASKELKMPSREMRKTSKEWKTTSEKTSSPEPQTQEASISAISENNPLPPNISERKTLSPNVKKFVLQRDQCCQYQDPLTKKICGSKRFLQNDHIQPVFADGNNDPTNLRIYCAQHNRFRYQKESSKKASNPHP